MILIAVVIGMAAAAFAFTSGWLSSKRLTPIKLVDALAPPGGPALGHRRNHAKGICYTGSFEANGAGTSLSTAPMLRSGRYPVVGRFNVASADFHVQDATVRVRGMGLQISEPGGQIWRMAMIDPPFFPVATPKAFYALLTASADKAPNAMKDFIATHREFAHFGAWAQSAPWTGSYAEEPYNSLDSFIFTDSAGRAHAVRWSFLPTAAVVPVPPEALAREDPDFLEEEINNRVKAGPLQWIMVVTVADPGDPTADPSQAWPKDRHTVNVGNLVVRQIEAEADGPCRDINYDPTVLPSGVGISDDPFPAARSSAYRRSYDLRSAETQYYPHTEAGHTEAGHTEAGHTEAGHSGSGAAP
jgi:catalase